MRPSKLTGALALVRSLSLSLICLSGPTSAFAADGIYHVADKQTLPGPVRWDYLSVDSASHRLFLTRADHVDVFDTLAKRVIGSIANTAGVHGVAIAPGLDRGYTSNGGANSVTVFALTSLTEIATIPVGGKPDSLVYDPKTQRVFVANASDKNLSVVDTATNAVIGTIALHGTPETAVVDGKGRLYIAIEDKNAIAVIDTHTLQVLRQIDVASVCDEPAGLAIDPDSVRLFAGCHNQKMAIVDGATGKILAAPVIGRGNDATAFDPARKLAFASNGDGTLTIVDGNAPYAVRQTLLTMPRARTMALDWISHAVYLVSAEVAAAPTVPATQPSRPALKPGTFTVLTITPR